MKKNLKAFTIAELLVTLFIAVIFVTAGYQLFTAVIADSGNARAEARAANVANDYLRRYADTVSKPCAASNPLTDSSITVDYISSVLVSVAITCPYASTTSVSKVTVTVKYNTPQAQVIYATLVNK